MTNEEILKLAKERKDYEVSAKVINVVQSETFQDRVTFVMDTEVPQINDEGKVEMKNTFSKNLYEIGKQLSSVPYIALANAYALGKMISPVLVNMVMKDADIKIKRTFRAKGSPRIDVGDATYPSDIYSTDFAGVSTHINPLFVPHIEKEAQNPRKRVAVTVDINNI